jgi:geranylgeranyl reductase family protein
MTVPDENRSANRPRELEAEIVIIGGGPGGCAAAARLAEAGLDVVVIEKEKYPREKVCGDGLTPRAIKALIDLGLQDRVAYYHRIRGIRAVGFGRTMVLDWPEHPVYPSFGATVPRTVLDADIASHAASKGARFLEGHEATAPAFDSGILEGFYVVAKDSGENLLVKGRYFVLADGFLARMSRSVGVFRDRRKTMGLAIRAYYPSPKHSDPYIEAHLEITQRGAVLPSYGWVFPLGDGTVNAGVGILTSYKGWKDVNTNLLQDELVRRCGPMWGFGSDDALAKPKGGKLPMGLSMSPKAGSNWVAVGDAAGAINPFNGEGIGYALELAEIAADLLVASSKRGRAFPFARYSEILDEMYGPYLAAAELFAYLIGKPKLLKIFGTVGMRSTAIMSWFLVVAAHLGDPSDKKITSRIYYAIERVVRTFPRVLA